MLVLERTTSTCRIPVVPQGRPTGLEGPVQCGEDRIPQEDRLVAANPAAGRQWMDATLEQRFIDIDVSESGHPGLIKQPCLDRPG